MFYNLIYLCNKLLLIKKKFGKKINTSFLPRWSAGES